LVCNFTTFGTISVNRHKTIIKTLQTNKQQETSTSKTTRHITYMFLRLVIHHNVAALERKHGKKKRSEEKEGCWCCHELETLLKP
jgi:hypothetical protein